MILMKVIFALLILAALATCQRAAPETPKADQGSPFSEIEMEKRAQEVYRDLVEQKKQYQKLETKIHAAQASGSSINLEMDAEHF
jgi:Skp family chaperone for outer membrane proteins